ncbi:MAG: M48 family metallopeptidase [Lentisphaeraceae bacterium]|nr:M48 family metallopeptidase [Lentisphaeraceae bacterium]
MNSSIKQFQIVDLADREIEETQKRNYYKKTHPELASLAELVADFSDERPLIENFGPKSQSMDNSPISKSEMDSSIYGEVIGSKNGIFYKASLVFSLGTMLSLSAMFCTLIIVVANFSYVKLDAFINGLSGTNIYSSISDGLMAVFCILFLVGLIKSICVKKEKTAKHETSREEEPVFFYYLEKTCAALEVPVPQRVFLNCEVDVSCHYRSLFSKDLDLHVGLPLVSGFSTKELSGILAHELCRFRKENMGLVERVRSLYIWVAKVTCHQDALDDYIYKLNKKVSKSPLKIPVYIAEMFFEIPRVILRGLMWITYLLCSAVIHKIDFDSDFYEIQFAGNKKFQEIAYSMEVMSQTLCNTQNGLETSRMNQTLHDDLPGHIAATTIMMNEEKHKIIEKFNHKKSKITEIHPTFSKRIKKAEKVNSPGIFGLEEPAMRLFFQLKKHKRNISLEQYKIFFGKDGVTLTEIQASDVELREMNELAMSWESIEKYFHGPVPFDKIPVVDRKHRLNAKNWIQPLRDLKKVHEEILSSLSSVDHISDSYANTGSFRKLLLCAKGIFSHNPSSALQLNLMGRKVNSKNVKGLLKGTTSKLDDMEGEMSRFYDLCSARLCCAIQLLNRKEFRSKMQNGELYRKNLSHILHFLRIFDHVKSSIVSLHSNYAEAKTILEFNRGNYELESYLSANRVLLKKSLKVVELKLQEIPYPFTEEKNLSLMNYIGFEVPDSDDYEALLYVAEEMYEKSTAVYFKVLSKLVNIAEEVEKSAGLNSNFAKCDHQFSLNRTCG